MADKMIILLSQIPFFPHFFNRECLRSFFFPHHWTERKEKGTESQKRMQWLLYLKKMISFMRFMCEKNIFPPNTFPI